MRYPSMRKIRERFWAMMPEGTGVWVGTVGRWGTIEVSGKGRTLTLYWHGLVMCYEKGIGEWVVKPEGTKETSDFGQKNLPKWSEGDFEDWISVVVKPLLLEHGII